jgi:cytochrome c-type biogenesis protein CcmH/NrfG
LDPADAAEYQDFVANLDRAQEIETEIPSLRAQAERNPSSIADWDLLGRAYGTLLDWSDAIDCFRHVLKLEPPPGDPAVQADLATALRQQSGHGQASAGSTAEK